jgi:hypothetical protein
MSPLLFAAARTVVKASVIKAGNIVGLAAGQYVVPSPAAPAARGMVSWAWGPSLSYTGSLAALIAREEAGAAAFNAAKNLAPVVCGTAGGIAAGIAIERLMFAAGFAYDYYQQSGKVNSMLDSIDKTETARPTLELA